MASPISIQTGQTGPRTPEGKATSSQNATSHGLSSTRVVLPHEDQSAFNQLLDELQKDLAPAGPHEAFLIQQMAECQWRLNRLRRIETALMDQLLLGAEPGAGPEDRMAKAMTARGGDPLDKIQRYAAAAERSYYRASRELTTYRKIQNEIGVQARKTQRLVRRAENEERIFGIPNPYKTSQPQACAPTAPAPKAPVNANPAAASHERRKDES
jgi:hypothetical protein